VILFGYLNSSVLNTDIFSLFLNLSHYNKSLLLISAYHSAGYFLADTIDILIDYTNYKRHIYILHHIVAFLGIMTVHLGSYLSVYAIWCLEIGGIVHHIKHAADVYRIDPILEVGSHLLYHIVYLFSRILLTLNVLNAFVLIGRSNNITGDLIGLLVSVILIIQNVIWWTYNVKKYFK
jgi:hypothetical protein